MSCRNNIGRWKNKKKRSGSRKSELSNKRKRTKESKLGLLR